MSNKTLSTQTHTLALLIDADNTSSDIFPQIMKKVEGFGKATIRRIYGNIETLSSQKWKDQCLLHALQQVPHVGVSGAKNATDIALTVDAMDLLHKETISSFCFVTGDQDFTTLFLRLRNQGLDVYCIGRPSKSDALTKACTKFISTEQLSTPPTASLKKIAKTVQKKLQPTSINAGKSHLDPKITKLLMEATKKLMVEKKLEWISVQRLGTALKQLDSGFNAKNYGQKNLPQLVKSRTDVFEIRGQENEVEVRLRQ